jgi:hypothetical protein
MMRIKLTWNESAPSGQVARREIDAEIGPEFFDKIAAAIELRAAKTLLASDPIESFTSTTIVDARQVRAAMAGMASVFRELARAERVDEVDWRARNAQLATDLQYEHLRRAAPLKPIERPCPPGFFCLHEPRCPGASNT